MFRLTIKQANEQLKSGKITSTDLVKTHFERIKKIDSDIKSYVLLLEELALKQASEIDKKGDFFHPLTGIPYAMKDLICMKGIRTTACSKMLENFIPPYSATVAEKLSNSICLGKTNCDEFAMGSSTENSAFFPTKNPWDLTRVPGGSSGGSASSVAADEAIFAIGTDTGGSVRQPAAFCGCVGLKVTYGRVSRSGVIAYASSFDTIGPITKTVEDAAIVLNQIAGQDPKDSTTPNVLVEDYTANLNKDIKGKKIAYVKEFMNAEGFDPEIKKQTEDTLKLLEKMGCEIGEVSIPELKYAIETYYVLVMSEASSNLSRYDGIKYGHTTEQAHELKDVYMKSRAEGFGPEPKRKIMLGTFILSAGYIDAYYKKAMKVRSVIKNGFDEAFKKFDAILAPVTPSTAFEIGKNTSDPLQMYLEDIFTGPINIAGIPGLSIPVGLIDGLPVGVQILGKQFAESEILNIGNMLEKQIGFKRELY